MHAPSPGGLIAVSISHAGNKFPLEVDLSASALAFKEQIYSLTGVPVDRYVSTLASTVSSHRVG